MTVISAPIIPQPASAVKRRGLTGGNRIIFARKRFFFQNKFGFLQNFLHSPPCILVYNML